MIPIELMGRAAVPGGGELRCCRHDGAFSFRLGNQELMTSRMVGSEQQLAELAIARCAAPASARVLVGGLGMGFTLAALLPLVGSDARIVVAELVPEVVQWNRELLGHLAGHPLRDARVEVRIADVADELAKARANGGYDAVLLDVDNGPAGLVRAANDRLYDARGLAVAVEALRPRGVLAVWSSAPDRAFAQRLRSAGLRVDEIATRARRTKGPRRTIWLGIAP